MILFLSLIFTTNHVNNSLFRNFKTSVLSIIFFLNLGLATKDIAVSLKLLQNEYHIHLFVFVCLYAFCVYVSLAPLPVRLSPLFHCLSLSAPLRACLSLLLSLCPLVSFSATLSLSLPLSLFLFFAPPPPPLSIYM